MHNFQVLHCGDYNAPAVEKLAVRERGGNVCRPIGNAKKLSKINTRVTLHAVPPRSQNLTDMPHPSKFRLA
jgi:hypothetical protein